MADEKNTQFNYLLNAVMHAAQEAHPAKAGYAGKYKALIAHVRELERKAALYDAEHKDGVPASPARLLVTVCEMRDGDGLTHCAMLHHAGQRAIEGMCVERRADRTEVEAEAAEWREFLAYGVAMREVPVTMEEVEQLAKTMWKGEPVPGRVLRFGAAVLGLADAAGVPVVVAANPALDQGPCTVCGKPWREHGTYPVYESHNYTPARGVRASDGSRDAG